MVANFSILLFSFILGIAGFAGYQTVFSEQSPPTEVVRDNITASPTIYYSIAEAPKSSLKAMITSMKGETLWEARTATQPAELQEMISVQQGERIATGEDGSMSVTFEAGITVSLEKNTTIGLTQTLPATVLFTHQQGSASYRQPDKKIPVAIRIRRLLVRMQPGTAIVTAEPEDPYIYVTVDSGSVEVAYNDAEFESQRLTISEGEVFAFNNDEREGSIE